MKIVGDYSLSPFCKDTENAYSIKLPCDQLYQLYYSEDYEVDEHHIERLFKKDGYELVIELPNKYRQFISAEVFHNGHYSDTCTISSNNLIEEQKYYQYYFVTYNKPLCDYLDDKDVYIIAATGNKNFYEVISNDLNIIQGIDSRVKNAPSKCVFGYSGKVINDLKVIASMSKLKVRVTNSNSFKVAMQFPVELDDFDTVEKDVNQLLSHLDKRYSCSLTNKNKKNYAVVRIGNNKNLLRIQKYMKLRFQTTSELEVPSYIDGEIPKYIMEFIEDTVNTV